MLTEELNLLYNTNKGLFVLRVYFFIITKEKRSFFVISIFRYYKSLHIISTDTKKNRGRLTIGKTFVDVTISVNCYVNLGKTEGCVTGSCES